MNFKGISYLKQKYPPKGIEKEKTRESEKRSYKKAWKKKILEEKENMKGQQAAFDKNLPGVWRAALFFLHTLNFTIFKTTNRDKRKIKHEKKKLL